MRGFLFLCTNGEKITEKEIKNIQNRFLHIYNTYAMHYIYMRGSRTKNRALYFAKNV